MKRYIPLLILLFYSIPATSYALSWSEGNPDEMEPGDTITLSIEGDCPPYTWKVDGKGYLLGASVTQDTSNTLNSDEQQCGSALLTVVDSCVGKIEGSARGGRGRWVPQGELYRCIPPCPPLTSDPPCSCYINHVQGPSRWCDEISGKTKVSYLNYRSPCKASWDDCPFLGGCDPGPLHPSWGMEGTLFTYYMREYEWQCPDIELSLPERYDQGACP